MITHAQKIELWKAGLLQEEDFGDAAICESRWTIHQRVVQKTTRDLRLPRK